MNVKSTTKVAAVIGDPVSHSKSPAMQNAAFVAAGYDAVFTAFPVTSSSLREAVRGMQVLGFLGASVTVPHKVAMVSLCDELDESAEACQAVNCLHFRAGKIVGYNTDAMGFVRALEEEKIDFTEKDVTILGAGGAARAVAVGVQKAGASSIEIITRSPGKCTWTSASPWTSDSLRERIPKTHILIDATSMGLSADSESNIPAPIPIGLLPENAVVSTLVYHRKTALLDAAEAAGHRICNGAGMLIHQGAIAFTIWTGCEAPLSAMWDAFPQLKTSET